jgi:hypothetical protein
VNQQAKTYQHGNILGEKELSHTLLLPQPSNHAQGSNQFSQSVSSYTLAKNNPQIHSDQPGTSSLNHLHSYFQHTGAWNNANLNYLDELEIFLGMASSQSEGK